MSAPADTAMTPATKVDKIADALDKIMPQGRGALAAANAGLKVAGLGLLASGAAVLTGHDPLNIQPWYAGIIEATLGVASLLLYELSPTAA